MVTSEKEAYMDQYTIRITILYDNTAYISDLNAKWGFSCLVERVGSPVALFDTGPTGPELMENMKILGVDPDCIEIVFISHPHWDHTDGLEEFLKHNDHATLVIPPAFNFSSIHKIIIASAPAIICEGIYTTGELYNFEQSMVVDSPEGMVVITGCSHPGIPKILKISEDFGRIHALIGGFHGFSELDLLKDISLVCPAHCTKLKDEILTRFPDKCIEGGAGRVIEI